MYTQDSKIQIFMRRSFGERFNVTFNFIRENWRPLLKYVTYALLPLCLIQAMSLNAVMDFSMRNSMTGKTPQNSELLALMGKYSLYMTVFVIGTVLLYSLVFSLFQLYGTRENRLQGVTWKEMTPLFLKNMKRMWASILTMVLLVLLYSVVMGVLILATPFSLIITIPAFIALMVPLALFFPTNCMEDIGVFTALKKSYRLGFRTWGSLFGFCFVMGLLANILQGITSIPWYVMYVIKTVFSMKGSVETFTASTGYNFVLYLLNILQVYGAYLGMCIMAVGIVFQYGHTREKTDNVSIDNDIEHFEEL
jgi:hypothetical protein